MYTGRTLVQFTSRSLSSDSVSSLPCWGNDHSQSLHLARIHLRDRPEAASAAHLVPGLGVAGVLFPMGHLV